MLAVARYMRATLGKQPSEKTMVRRERRMDLQSVVLLGRTFAEYCRYFQLSDNDLQDTTILDLGAGVSSFCAEASSRGFDVTAADPIFEFDANTIAQKSRIDLDEVVRQLPGVADKYNWTFYRNPEGLARYRETARRNFLDDYVTNRRRYHHASLPKTPFVDRQFSTVLISYFLFLYDDLLDYGFHKQSVREAVRIAGREVRIYPLANLSAERSAFVEMLLKDSECSDLQFTIVKSEFEFVKNSNELMIIRRR
jgi:hypothetical protein